MALGKSTMAKIISGLEKPNKGQALVDEIDTRNKKDFLKIRKKILDITYIIMLYYLCILI